MSSKIEVVVTTYNNPSALDMTLAGLYHQDFKEFDVCVADDGSSLDTKLIIDKWYEVYGSKIRHEWIPDCGFNKNKILNIAIGNSKADYLIFIDGDCVASPRFVSRHLELRKPQQFISGGVIRLSEKASKTISTDLIASKKVFQRRWLDDNGCLSKLGTNLKAGLYPSSMSNILELISPVKKTWNGGNASTWRKYIVLVNGFDELLKYGAEDIEMGYRLSNSGIIGRSIRYTAPLLHLEHERTYANDEIVKKNKLFAKEVKMTGVVWTNNGMLKK